MRKINSMTRFALCAAMALGLTACGEQGAAKETTTAPAATEQTAAAEKSTADSTAAAEAAATPEAVVTDSGYDEEAWKKEPAYGETVIYYYTGGNCTSAPWFAEVLGYFEEEGIKAEKVSGTSVTEALGTNSAQCAINHVSHMLVPATNGVDLQFVAGGHTGCRSLYALADSEFNSTSDLIGKKVSIPDGIGSSGYNITTRFFDMDGIDPKNDVSIIQVENDAAMKALESGEVSATLFADTYAYSFVKEGTLKFVRSLTDDDFAQEPCCVFAMNGTFAKENPITARKVVNAVRKASAWMEANSVEAVEMLLEANLLTGDYDMNVDTFTALNFDLDKEFTGKALEKIVADYIRLDLITAYEKDQQEEVMELVWNPLED